MLYMFIFYVDFIFLFLILRLGVFVDLTVFVLSDKFMLE
jgi:hypothetical protein